MRGWKSLMRQIFAVVPPHVVGHDVLQAEALRDIGGEDRLRPPGPDSTRRTGNSAAVSTETRPPPEWIMKTGQVAPISASLT